jgi:hypothetical protein
MRAFFAALAIVAFSAALPRASIAQERPVQLEALPQPIRESLSAWLQRDCSVGALPEELTRLRALSGAVQEALVEAYTQGPPPNLERFYRAAFSEAFDARNAALAREGARLFGKEDVTRLQTADRDTYLRRRLEEARVNYRTNAVLGLGVVNARGALPLLTQIAAEPDNPMREAAARSIALLKEPQVPPPEEAR